MIEPLLVAALLFARTPLKPGWNLYTHEQDIQIGRQASPLVEKQVQLAKDAELGRYIANIGKRLVAVAPYNDYPFTFKVIRDKNVNAFALPGGPVYILTGTIENAENESQLAGVIAHEIAHVVLRHATATASKAKVAEGGLALIGEIFGRSIVTAGAAFTLNSGFLRYSRENEKEADLLGAQIVYDSKLWNPLELARFFENLERQTHDRPLEFFSDHPDPGNRVDLVSREVAELGAPHRATGDDQFSRMKRLAAEMDHDAPAAAADSASSSNIALKPYNGRNYRISYPATWEVGRESQNVTLGSPDGASGAIVGSFDPEGRSLEETTRRLVEKLRRENPGWRMGGAFQHITVGGLPGESATTEAGGETDWLVTALRPDGSLWYIIFIANDREYSRMRPVFQRMIDSVRLVN